MVEVGLQVRHKVALVRNFLLFLHVAGAVLLLGPTTMATSRFARHATRGELAEASGARRTSRAYGTASVVVPALGITLAARNQSFDQAWVQLAIGLFVAGAVVLAAVHLPAQRVALDRLESGEPIAEAVVGRLRASAGLYALSWVAIVWLMVAKPS
jgi:uncharacterized membrane protein